MEVEVAFFTHFFVSLLESFSMLCNIFFSLCAVLCHNFIIPCVVFWFIGSLPTQVIWHSDSHFLVAEPYLLIVSSLQMSLIRRSEFCTSVMAVRLQKYCTAVSLFSVLQNFWAGHRAHSTFCSVVVQCYPRDEVVTAWSWSLTSI